MWEKGARILMKRKIGMISLAVLLAISVSACGIIQKDKKKESKNTSSESDSSENDKEEDQYSPIIAKDVEVPDIEYPYMIKVNKAMNCITVYTVDENNEYTVPERALICSTGGDETPEGTFQLGESVDWQMLSDGNYGRYVTHLVDDVLIRSVNYLAQSEDALDVDSYNSLGDTISGSSIVVGDADAKWIAENCPEGTKVEVYNDDKEAGPLGKPVARLISDKITWDPTDPSSENAWYVPVSFFGIEDKVISIGETPDLLSGVTAKDKYGNDLTASIKIYGEVDSNTAGDYKITYSCKNEDGEEREVKINVTVEGDVSAALETEQPEAAKEPAKQPEATKEPVNTPAPSPSSTPTIEPTQTPKQEEAVQTNNSYEEIITTTTVTTTVEQVDNEPPKISLVANTPYVTSLSDAYLRQRISVTDNLSGVEGIYISLCRIPENGSYIVVYEAFDNAGNGSCISETVYIN